MFVVYLWCPSGLRASYIQVYTVWQWNSSTQLWLRTNAKWFRGIKIYSYKCVNTVIAKPQNWCKNWAFNYKFWFIQSYFNVTQSADSHNTWLFHHLNLNLIAGQAAFADFFRGPAQKLHAHIHNYIIYWFKLDKNNLIQWHIIWCMQICPSQSIASALWHFSAHHQTTDHV